jgi:hypothetical protein
MTRQTSTAELVSTAHVSESEESTGIRPARLIPETLSVADARELRWYLAGDALFMPQGSTFGAQLERMANLIQTEPCTRCGGKIRPYTPGSGRAPNVRNQQGKRLGYRQAIEWWQRRELKRMGVTVTSGRGLDAMRALGLAAVHKDEIGEMVGPLPDSLLEKCKRCDGSGVTVLRERRGTPTAKPMGSSRKPWTDCGVMMGDPNLARYGRASRRLGAVRSADPVGSAALELYHQPGGSYGSVWVMTEAGTEMLSDNPQRLHPEQLFGNLRAANQEKANSRLSGLFSRASFEAGLLVRRGARAWNAFGPLVAQAEVKTREPDADVPLKIAPAMDVDEWALRAELPREDLGDDT